MLSSLNSSQFFSSFDVETEEIAGISSSLEYNTMYKLIIKYINQFLIIKNTWGSITLLLSCWEVGFVWRIRRDIVPLSDFRNWSDKRRAISLWRSPASRQWSYFRLNQPKHFIGGELLENLIVMEKLILKRSFHK